MLSDRECIRREVPIKCHLFGDNPRARHMYVCTCLFLPSLFQALQDWDHSLVFLANPTVPPTMPSGIVNSSLMIVLSVRP